MLIEDREYFVPFEDYPAFKKATVEQIYQFQQLSPEQFHWEGLDIDIELDALKHPEQYLLKFQ